MEKCANKKENSLPVSFIPEEKKAQYSISKWETCQDGHDVSEIDAVRPV